MTVGDTLGNAQALVDTLIDTEAEMEELSVGHTWGGAQALVDALADTLTEVEALISGDTLGDAHALNDLLSNTWRHIGQCGDTVRQAGLHCTREGGGFSRRHTGWYLGTGRRLG